ncbi:hypothetical protein FACS189454_07210 [Planctomycetales bacterium]|nr:hypothetical protein FACS189454_07210 [Planctomycetales bacterium]
MLRFFFYMILCSGLFYSVGCQLNRKLIVLSPSQIISSERGRRGIEAQEQGHWKEAEKHLEEAVKLNKKDAAVRLHYADVLWQNGKREESLRQLDDIAKHCGGEDANLQISLAEKYLEMQHYELAERSAAEAVRLAPTQYRAWVLSGKTKMCLAATANASETRRYYLEAKEDYLRAASLSQDQKDILRNEILPKLAETQRRCGQPQQALATLLSLEKMYPQGKEPAALLQCKAETLFDLNRNPEATACLNTLRQR